MSVPLLLDTDTLTPPPGAAPAKVTAQLVAPPDGRLVGLHTTEDNATGGSDKVSDAEVDDPPSLAVRTTVPPPLIVPAVMTKLVVVEPAGTVTERGTVMAGLLIESNTVAPPDGAAAAKVTVQLLVAPDIRVVESQANEDRGTGGPAKANDTVSDDPFRLAVSTAVSW